jgi:hypothetical protein
MSVAAAAEAAAVPVNGKVSLGTRRLVVSHVENAASFFAYQEAQAGYMKEIAEACRDQCSAGLTPLNHPPTLHQVSREEWNHSCEPFLLRNRICF